MTRNAAHLWSWCRVRRGCSSGVAVRKLERAGLQFPAGFHLYPTMANKINSRGQISGMATDLNDGTIHAFLATPADRAESDTVARQKETRATPKVTLPENVRRMLLRGLGFRGIRAER